jgi:hypothetical protein
MKCTQYSSIYVEKTRLLTQCAYCSKGFGCILNPHVQYYIYYLSIVVLLILYKVLDTIYFDTDMKNNHILNKGHILFHVY